MAGYAYINPLAGLSSTHILSLSPYVIGGYAYINPLAGLSSTHILSLSPYVIGGYAYINPLAGLGGLLYGYVAEVVEGAVLAGVGGCGLCEGDVGVEEFVFEEGGELLSEGSDGLL